MAYGFLDIASTPGVRATQEANGSGEYWANFHDDRLSDRFTPPFGVMTDFLSQSTRIARGRRR